MAASLAAFGAWGIWTAAVLLLAAFFLNRAVRLWVGILEVLAVIFLGIICPGLLLPALEGERTGDGGPSCPNNLKQIGISLYAYHEKYHHFPEAITRDANGKPLLSWRAQILPMMEYGPLYDRLRHDEPWNSTHNAKICGPVPIPTFQCPDAYRGTNDCTTNYLAVIGPGTAWRKEGPVKSSDLPDDNSRTVMVVETVNSGVHWAEPYDLTVEEALARLKSDLKGEPLTMDKNNPEPRISSNHSGKINVLFADGRILTFPKKMPLSLWEKLLAGNVKDVGALSDQYFPKSPEPSHWSYLLSLLVWLLSVVLLFRRAMISRRDRIALSSEPIQV
ncbi:MAG: DUF1559 domain-containing protein [Pirellulales bacterium]|nr:DUF1559 domain-containing protein [Pirellulales bacterium]